MKQHEHRRHHAKGQQQHRKSSEEQVRPHQPQLRQHRRVPFLTGLRLTELCRQRHRVSQPCGDLLRVPVRQLKGNVLLVFLHHIGGSGNISLVQLRRPLRDKFISRHDTHPSITL